MTSLMTSDCLPHYMQHAHGARARELGRLGRLLRARAGTIWRDLVRGAISLDCLSLPASSTCACRHDLARSRSRWALFNSAQFTSTRVLTTAPVSISHRTRACSPRRPHPFPLGPSRAHHGARIPSPQDPRGTRPPFARNRLHHDPIAGELLLFPPWLVHGVTPSCELAPVRVVDCH
jgi:hypothetical protein